MEIGIFAKTFVRSSVGDVLDAAVAHGLHTVQFNLACAGLPTLPDVIDPDLVAQIRAAFVARGMTMAAISGTFNMSHPDRRVRADGLRRLGVLAAACHGLGASIITLCSGTRDPGNMWRAHPENRSPAARRDLIATLERALLFAEQYDVTLAVEPEVNNVVDSADQARRLLAALDAPRLRVVIDGANLMRPNKLPRMLPILDEAFALLGDAIVLAHAKDLSRTEDTHKTAPGQGELNFEHYLRLLLASGYPGPLIVHGVAEAQVGSSLAFLQSTLATVQSLQDA